MVKIIKNQARYIYKKMILHSYRRAPIVNKDLPYDRRTETSTATVNRTMNKACVKSCLTRATWRFLPCRLRSLHVRKDSSANIRYFVSCSRCPQSWTCRTRFENRFGTTHTLTGYRGWVRWESDDTLTNKLFMHWRWSITTTFWAVEFVFSCFNLQFKNVTCLP